VPLLKQMLFFLLAQLMVLSMSPLVVGVAGLRNSPRLLLLLLFKVPWLLEAFSLLTVLPVLVAWELWSLKQSRCLRVWYIHSYGVTAFKELLSLWLLLLLLVVGLLQRLVMKVVVIMQGNELWLSVRSCRGLWCLKVLLAAAWLSAAAGCTIRR
jgi:hypothetical protein